MSTNNNPFDYAEALEGESETTVEVFLDFLKHHSDKKVYNMLTKKEILIEIKEKESSLPLGKPVIFKDGENVFAMAERMKVFYHPERQFRFAYHAPDEIQWSMGRINRSGLLSCTHIPNARTIERDLVVYGDTIKN